MCQNRASEAIRWGIRCVSQECTTDFVVLVAVPYYAFQRNTAVQSPKVESTSLHMQRKYDPLHGF